LSSLTPYAEEITGDHQCGYRRSSSTADHIFYIRQMLEKGGRSCIIFSLSWYTHETGKINRNVSD
jgi:hypothetical protein